jgi:flavin reductase (DIM6/NTAB) family NADH-FMN oxidoreductase RutF
MSGIAFRELDPHDRYKLLCGVVVPRPIALVTTLDANGKVNAAPFSFFNVFSDDPPLVVLGLQHKADLSPKDTTRNIHRSGQFVVHMVDEALAAAMNDCAVDFPYGNSEAEAMGQRHCRRSMSPCRGWRLHLLRSSAGNMSYSHSDPAANCWLVKCCACMRAKV